MNKNINSLNIIKSLQYTREDTKAIAYLIKITSSPILIQVNSDGTLNIDENITISSYIDILSSKLPQPASLKDVKCENKRKEFRCVYQVGVIQNVFPYTVPLVESLIQEGETYLNIRQRLSELGKDIELVLSACSRAYTISQIISDQWKGYDLTFAEVLEMDQVAAARREVSVRRANWENSDSFPNLSKIEVITKTSKFEEELMERTTTLWKILHLGANYLSGLERSQFLMINKGIDKKTRASNLDQKLIKLRLAHLLEYRRDPINYKLPRIKS